jgi:hypothetical protein
LNLAFKFDEPMPSKKLSAMGGRSKIASALSATYLSLSFSTAIAFFCSSSRFNFSFMTTAALIRKMMFWMT